ncbi:DUF3489 domain-containing protein [Eleftheria terrae]|uniref:DUF3489 domain-containing protein n=1 Tax=Eleftheria terrae TaxID=1597781 RepID=UPI00263A4893|nr:DUF3489 domain-containing protein [Eleftheria terrae]WKB56006.1 DUF3489 domain-containing protein [Eleftheria terrae]
MTATTLTATQRETLTHAAEHNEGRIEWFPASVKGGARAKVLQGLEARGWAYHDRECHALTDAGYQVIGQERHQPKGEAVATDEDTSLEADVAAAEASWAGTQPVPARKTRAPRDGSKQAQVIALLRRPSGATVAEIQALTGWLPHTVRGTFSGSFRKRLGLQVVSAKEDGGKRVYRIVEAGDGEMTGSGVFGSAELR